MQEHIARLVTRALDNFDAPGQTVSALVRQAARIASLRQDFSAQYRFQLELLEVRAGAAKTDPVIENINHNLITLLGVEGAEEQVEKAYEAYSRARKVGEGENRDVTPVSQLDLNLQRLQSLYDEHFVSGKGLTNYGGKAADGGQATLLPRIQQQTEILERIRQDVHSYLVLVEANLHTGKPSSSVFERGLQYVRTALVEHAPAALDKFTAAESRLAAGTPEDLSQALTSTRRMIKDIADALYPATGETIIGDDKVGRVMDDDAYRNRLTQFAKEKLGKHLQGKVMGDALSSYGKRITNLDSMASKGVHGEVTTAEAEQCVIWSFMLAADLLRIADGTAAEFAREESALP